MEIAVFYILTALALGMAVLCVVMRNPLSSALALVVSLVAVAGLFATLSAHFLFAVQLLVYAGAIMVLVLYVIMLLNLKKTEFGSLGLSKPRFLIAMILVAVVATVTARIVSDGPIYGTGEVSAGFGSVAGVAELLFTRYLFSFEVVGVLLLAAVIGVVVLAMRKF